MITHLHGILTDKTPGEAVIECQGVGYGLLISMATYGQLPDTGATLRLYTVLIPREDSLTLYGFGTVAEREAFLQLNSVSGVGPRTALGILSSLPITELQNHILTNNPVALQKMQGIGRKTAERIIIELRDKINKLHVSSAPAGQEDGNLQIKLIQQDAIAALVSLGYQRTAAEKAIRTITSSLTNEKPTADLLIRKALRLMQQ
jgi:Holliday junction DNA helicase RuvA